MISMSQKNNLEYINTKVLDIENLMANMKILELLIVDVMNANTIYIQLA
jgi:hypothetical protein